MTTIGALIAIYIALFFTNKEHIKEVSENHFYKINLLHDLVGILYEILGSIRISIRIQNQHTQDNKDYESLKIKFEGFKYWADRISQINSNIYVPPEIRDAISMFLHQGVKPITFNEFANDKDFVETTVFLHLDRVIESQYMTADKDLSIMKFLGKVQNTKNSILNLLSKNV